MAKFESTIRAINRQMESLFKSFGEQSIEYQTAKKQLEVNFKNVPGAMYTDASGITKITRGKATSAASKEVNRTRNLQKRQGTAQKQAKKYREKLKSEGRKTNKENIKKKAEERYTTKLENDSFYEENYSSIQDNTDLFSQWVKAGKNATWKEGVINSDFELAKAMTQAERERDRIKTEERSEGSTTFRKGDLKGHR